MDALIFYAFAAVAVVAALLVVAQRSPMYSVMLLIVMFGSLAGLYVLLDAPFIAVIQIIIYAGAIMVLFLFVVMLLNVAREDALPGAVSPVSATTMKIGAVLSGLLGLELVWALSRLGRTWFPDYEEVAGVSAVSRIGRELFTTHAFAFEATSILILAAMVGAVVLARRERQP